MTIINIIELLSGIALFLFGMSLMSDGLKNVAGSKMELVLYRLSGTTLKGVLLGTAVTAVIQSSSATSVMVVGFVNSSIMTLKQAISVILGSILGTSITGWIIALGEVGGGSGWLSLLSTAALTGIISIVGIIIKMTRSDKIGKYVSLILLGFAVLMYGISSMSEAVAPLKESEKFISFMLNFSNPILGILLGLAVTAVLQSASSAVGLLQALAVTGAINFSIAFPILLGINVGACVPVLLSSAGAKTDAKRSAYSYLLLSLLGSVLVGIIYYVSEIFVSYSFASAALDAFQIALLNTLFRLMNVILLLPVTALIEKMLCRLIKGNENEEEKAVSLEDRFLSSPAVAIEHTRLAIEDMAKHTLSNIENAVSLIYNFDRKKFEKAEASENLIDRYEDKIGAYIMRINANSLTKSQSEALSKYLHAIGDLERISDHSLNIAECAEEISEKKIVFSVQGASELKTALDAMVDVLSTAITAFISDDLDLAYHVEPLEETIDTICDSMKLHHIERLRSNQCTLEHGFVFNDLITNIERVSDHSSNIALSVIELKNSMFDPHEYIDELMLNRNGSFEAYFNEYQQKYKLEDF